MVTKQPHTIAPARPTAEGGQHPADSHQVFTSSIPFLVIK